MKNGYIQLGRMVKTMRRDVLKGELKLEELLRIYLDELQDYLNKGEVSINKKNLLTYITRFEEIIEYFEIHHDIQKFRDEFEQMQKDYGLEVEIPQRPKNNYDPNREVPARDRAGDIGANWSGCKSNGYGKDPISVPGLGTVIIY